MKCKDCTHKILLHDMSGRDVWTCGQTASDRAGRPVDVLQDGCTWHDQDDVLPPLYHIARGEDVGAIRKLGLVPMIGNRSAEAGEKSSAVYFFKTPQDAENAMLNWMGDDADGPLYMLTAVLPKSYAAALEDTAAYETACTAPVPPDYLDFQDLDEWYAWYQGKGAPANAAAV